MGGLLHTAPGPQEEVHGLMGGRKVRVRVRVILANDLGMGTIVAGGGLGAGFVGYEARVSMA